MEENRLVVEASPRPCYRLDDLLDPCDPTGERSAEEQAWLDAEPVGDELLDQTTLEPEAVGGGIKGRIAQLLMMVAFGRRVDAALDWAARLTLLLRQAEGGADEFRRFIVYLAAVQDDEVIETFKEALERHGLDLGGEIMTYAEKLLAEGEARGEARGRMENQVEVVEGLLRAGVTWEVIEAATGLNEASFRTLKAQLSGPGA